MEQLLNLSTLVSEGNSSSFCERRLSRRCPRFDSQVLSLETIQVCSELLQQEKDLDLELEMEKIKTELKSLCDGCVFKPDDNPIEISELKQKRILGRQATYSDLLTAARRLGLSIIEGGNHPYNIIGFDGSKFSVPCHPGSLSPRVISNANKFLANFILN